MREKSGDSLLFTHYLKISMLLEMRNIVKSFGGVAVLKGACLCVNGGEVHALVGENGAGKSTLMKILTGIIPQDSGGIYWQGQPVRFNTPRESQRHGISMIFQELNLASHLSVGENIFLGNEPLKYSAIGVIDRKSLVRQAQTLIQMHNFPLQAEAIVRNLSPAQKQIVEICRALASASKLVIMDEPTSSLSDKEARELFRAIGQLKQRGVAVIYISHRLEELYQVGDRITIMRDGETVYTGDMRETRVDEIIRYMVGRELRQFFPKEEVSVGEESLRVEGLCRKGVLNDISFTLRRGEIVGIAGLVGAGRTELAQAIFGIDSIDSGKIFIDGKERAINSPRDAIAAGLALVTEDRKSTGLALTLSVNHNITLASLSRIASLGRLNLRREQSISKSFVEKLEIKTSSIHKKVFQLSGGNQQKTILAKWLFAQARIFLFDEPTRGIDVGTKVEVFRLMIDLAKQGASILMISSDLPELLGMCDRILVMKDGRITKELIASHTDQEEVLRYATVGA